MIIVNEQNFFQILEETLLESDKEVYSARIEEETDGTYDIRIWDERLEESCEDIEEGHFASYEVSDIRLNQIIEENPNVVFLKVEKK